MTHILTFPNFATAGQYNVLNLLKYIEDIHCVECCEIENGAGDHATILFNSIQQVKRQKKLQAIDDIKIHPARHIIFWHLPTQLFF